VIVELDHDAGEYRQRAETPAEADHLRHQAEILAVARHPGVAELLGWDGSTLRLRLLFTDRPTDTATAAVVAATTIADLHDLGIAHRDLRPEHLLWDGTGAPVWCGFGHAAAGVDPDGQDAAADVAGLATVLTSLLPDRDMRRALAAAASRPRRLSARRLAEQLAATVSPEPLTVLPHGRPARRPSLWRQRRGLTATTRHDLTPAAKPVAKTPAQGATSWRQRRGLTATTRHDLTPAAKPVAKTRAKGDRKWPHPHRGGRNIAVVAGVAGAAVLLTAAALSVGDARTSPRAARSAVSPGPNIVATGCPQVDLGCGPLPHRAGVVAVAGGRYRMGEPDDIVVIGRWGCRAALAALLHPATGQIWVFPSWARQGTTVPGHLLTAMPGAVTLRVDPGNDGCDTLGVIGAGDKEVAISAGAGP
jgi:hypothetical protein